MHTRNGFAGKCQAVIVPGTGLGGMISGLGGLCEFGKIGLNPGSNVLHTGFPRTVGTFDFASETAIVDNFRKLLEGGAPLSERISALDIANFRDAESQFSEAARVVYSAMAHVLADFVYLLARRYDVGDVSLGGGILQGTTRTFVIEEMLVRARRLGMNFDVVPHGVIITSLDVVSPFEISMKSFPASSAEEFADRAIEKAFAYFSPVDSPAHRRTLMPYLPLFAVEQILNELGKKFPDSVRKTSVALDGMAVHMILANVPKASVQARGILASHLFCELQTRAMIGGYAAPSVFEGPTLHTTLDSLGLDPVAQEGIESAYHDHHFAVLIETYREMAVRRQHCHPPCVPMPYMLPEKWQTPGKTIVGIDIGAGSWKAVAVTWSGKNMNVQAIGPVIHGPTPVSEQVFFASIALAVGKPFPLRVCVAWPGAVDACGPAQYSGIFKCFDAMPGGTTGIVDTKDAHLDRLNIPDLLKAPWPEAQIRVCNDGAAFGAYYWNQDLFAGKPLPTRFHGAAGAAILAAS